MWTRLGLALGLLLCGVAPALADGYVESSGTYAEGAQIRGNRYDTGGNQKVTLGTLLSGEDQTNGVMKVEQQFSRGLSTGDQLIKTGTGFLHAISCWGNDAAATAGDIAVRDATSAGAGTVILRYWISAAAMNPATHQLNVPFTTGLYIDYTTTADVTCTVSYR